MRYKSLSWKNFLSYGNIETTIELDTNESINICGTNGMGKSTFLDALHFALTGKPYRKIKKDQIPNSTNKKDCTVVLKLEHKGKEIVIERGIKPDIFTITIDKKSINEVSESLDQQEWLNNFLGINPKTLKNTQIISSSYYTPFLQMSPQDKRAFIEDILNIDIISSILKNLKKEFTVVKEGKKDTGHIIDKLESNVKIIEDMLKKKEAENIETSNNIKIELENLQKEIDNLQKDNEDIEKKNIDLSSKYENIKVSKEDLEKTIEKDQDDYKKHIEEMNNFDIDLNNLKDQISENKEKIDNNNNKITINTENINRCNEDNKKLEKEKHAIKIMLIELKENKENLITEINELEEKIKSDQEKLNTNTETYNSSMIKGSKAEGNLESEKKRYENEIEFFNHNDTCSTCKHDLDHDYKEKMIEEIKNNLEMLEGKRKSIEEKIANLAEVKVKLDKLNNTIKGNEESLRALKDNQSEIKSSIDNYDVKIKDNNSTIEKNSDEIKSLQKEIDDKEIILTDLTNDRKSLIEKQEQLEEKIKSAKEKWGSKIEEIKNVERNINSLNTEMIQIQGNIDNYTNKKETNTSLINRHLKDILSKNEMINRLKNFNDDDIQKKHNIEKEIAETKQKLEAIERKILSFDLSFIILSDKGIRHYIVKKYIPMLNKYVNQFLDIFNAHYRLQFDDELNEKIAVKGYDKLSYYSLSAGERVRCDLSLLFAFLNISKIRNKVSSNLLIIDEVADANLDSEGLEGLLNLIANLKRQGYTIFTISHRPELKERFDKTYQAIKKRFTNLTLL